MSAKTAHLTVPGRRPPRGVRFRVESCQNTHETPVYSCGTCHVIWDVPHRLLEGGSSGNRLRTSPGKAPRCSEVRTCECGWILYLQRSTETGKRGKTGHGRTQSHSGVWRLWFGQRCTASLWNCIMLYM